MFEGATPSVRIDSLLIDRDGQQSEQVGAGAYRHHVQRARRTAGVDAHLTRTGLRQRHRHMDARGHAVGRNPHSPDPIAVRRVQGGAAAGQGTNYLEDR